MAAPIPRDEPVTSATRPLSCLTTISLTLAALRISSPRLRSARSRAGYRLVLLGQAQSVAARPTAQAAPMRQVETCCRTAERTRTASSRTSWIPRPGAPGSRVTPAGADIDVEQKVDYERGADADSNQALPSSALSSATRDIRPCRLRVRWLPLMTARCPESGDREAPVQIRVRRGCISSRRHFKA